MLPSAKQSLQLGGLSSRAAAWTLILCFLAGVVGIQIISRILHHYIPHHVVDCDHSHGEDEEHSGHPHSRRPSRSTHHSDHDAESHASHAHHNSEMAMRESASTLASNGTQGNTFSNGTLDRRQSLPYQLGSKVSGLVSLKKPQCDTHGQCYGFSEPCGFECFNNISQRGGSRQPSYSSTGGSAGGSFRHPGLARSATTSRVLPRVGEQTPLLHEIREDATLSPPKSASPVISANGFSRPSSYTSLPPPEDASTEGDCEQFDEDDDEDEHGHDHHHHVPNNAFLSIGLQTSIAIAVHKLPEGFITYATNHANPKLGFSVFMALFIHNITEGFAMALPLYLAINSRPKAMFWSSLLGGVSQPLGAGIAALWFKLAGTGDSEPGEGVYGGMFAITGELTLRAKEGQFPCSSIHSWHHGFGGVTIVLGELGLDAQSEFVHGVCFRGNGHTWYQLSIDGVIGRFNYSLLAGFSYDVYECMMYGEGSADRCFSFSTEEQGTQQRHGAVCSESACK